jgi:hypothetical protein
VRRRIVDVNTLTSMAFAATLVAGLYGASAGAQRPLDAPPALPAATPAPAPEKPGSSRRTVARLPEAERAKDTAPAPANLTEPADDELLPPARQVAPETRIEQKRQGNRIVEIIVTPQGSTNSYVIVNREGRPPLTTQELSSGLSTPRFLRFDF